MKIIVVKLSFLKRGLLNVVRILRFCFECWCKIGCLTDVLFFSILRGRLGITFKMGQRSFHTIIDFSLVNPVVTVIKYPIRTLRKIVL
jgi:hypothetical protein